MTKTYDPLPWGNRRQLLPKRVTYAFSMDINLAVEVPFKLDTLAPVCWPPRQAENGVRDFSKCESQSWNTYRIPGVGEFVTSQGQRPDTPLARLLHADDRIVLSNRITGSLAGRLLFETDTPGLLRMDYTGVVNFKGWKPTPAATDAEANDHFRDVRGTAFVSARQEIGSPKYRWLVHNQLIGICRIAPALKGKALRWVQEPNARGLGLLLAFSYDFYVGS